jgi:nicotinamidase/pyrazinamidase
LRTRGITKLTVVGLALDFCVNYSAVDGANLGFDVEIREQLCRGIDLNGSMVQAMEEFQKTGVKVV